MSELQLMRAQLVHKSQLLDKVKILLQKKRCFMKR
jgi:hypothetical protein